MDDQDKVIGYVLTMDGGSTYLFLGTTPDQVAEAVETELSGLEGMPVDDRPTYWMEAREFTQDEIDNMPEFEGW